MHYLIECLGYSAFILMFYIIFIAKKTVFHLKGYTPVVESSRNRPFGAHALKLHSL